MADRVVHHSADPGTHVMEVCGECIELRHEVEVLAQLLAEATAAFAALSETLWAHFDDLAEDVAELERGEEEEPEGEPEEEPEEEPEKI